MARRCAVTGKGVMTGNNVSHAMNHTKRRFLPNLQRVSFWSDSLNKAFRLRVTPHGMRTIEHKGGLDAYVLGTSKTKLEPELQKIKKLVEGAQS